MLSRIFAGLKFSTALIAMLALAAPGFAEAPKPAFKPMDVFDLQWAKVGATAAWADEGNDGDR